MDFRVLAYASGIVAIGLAFGLSLAAQHVLTLSGIGIVIFVFLVWTYRGMVRDRQAYRSSAGFMLVAIWSAYTIGLFLVSMWVTALIFQIPWSEVVSLGSLEDVRRLFFP